ncbi:MAG: hypothetical protein KGQ68_05270 [Gammaproteobacteria bacterium]|nr:hypothetical protein [Gammaproteobacteria bacterium]
MNKTATVLDDIKVHVKLKISAAWASVMFLYIYADYFGLYVPGALQHMLAGKMGPLGSTTQIILLFTSAMIAIPSLMIFLTLVLKTSLNRWLNMLFGTLYTAIILITMWSWMFYIFYGIIEIGLTLLIVWYAWNWPRKPTK